MASPLELSRLCLEATDGGTSRLENIDSHADLKLFGSSTFTMRYHYQEVNGRILPLAVLRLSSPPERTSRLHGDLPQP